jgi:hypothetical protein
MVLDLKLLRVKMMTENRVEIVQLPENAFA